MWWRSSAYAALGDPWAFRIAQNGAVKTHGLDEVMAKGCLLMKRIGLQAFNYNKSLVILGRGSWVRRLQWRATAQGNV